MSGFFGSEETTQSSATDVRIPDFLRPFLEQGAGTASGALRSLQNLVGGGDLVAGFTPDQEAAFQQVRELSGNVPGQGILEAAASGIGLDFLPDSVRRGLSSLGGIDFLPQFTRDALTAGGGVPTTATDALGNAINAEVLPAASRTALTTAASGGFAPDQLETLQRTAGGDFLFGGEGFDQAVEAAVRAARPGILSTFGGAGVGGGTGALSQAAIGQSATDAFARQFAQERQNQLGAARTLADLGLAGTAQQLGAAESLAGLGLQGRAQRIGAADVLGRLGLSGRGQDIQSAGLLGGFAEGAEGRSLEGLGLLSGLSDAERARQLTSAGALPGLAFGGAESLLNIGNLQQQLAQQQLGAPLDAQLRLLSASLGGLPISSLLGQSTTGSSETSGFGFGFGG